MSETDRCSAGRMSETDRCYRMSETDSCSADRMSETDWCSVAECVKLIGVVQNE